MELLIIRHGRPVRDTRADGEFADPELSEIGWNQARATAAFLEGEHIDHVVASTMIRAHQTAMPTAENALPSAIGVHCRPNHSAAPANIDSAGK